MRLMSIFGLVCAFMCCSLGLTYVLVVLVSILIFLLFLKKFQGDFCSDSAIPDRCCPLTVFAIVAFEQLINWNRFFFASNPNARYVSVNIDCCTDTLKSC